MVLDPIPQSLPVHFFGSRPQPPTSRNCLSRACRAMTPHRNESRHTRCEALKSLYTSNFFSLSLALQHFTSKALHFTKRDVHSTKRALHLNKRALHLTERALHFTNIVKYLTKRALYFTGKALRFTKRALCSTTRVKYLTKRAKIFQISV